MKIPEPTLFYDLTEWPLNVLCYRINESLAGIHDFSESLQVQLLTPSHFQKRKEVKIRFTLNNTIVFAKTKQKFETLK